LQDSRGRVAGVSGGAGRRAKAKPED
jgi:hypothetical protein